MDLPKHPCLFSAHDNISPSPIDECRVFRFPDREGKVKFPANRVGMGISLGEIC